MAGVGPAPKRDAARRNKRPEMTQLVAPESLAGFELPDDVLPPLPDGMQLDPDRVLREEWHPATRRWWDAWRSSPQASRMLSEPDWHFLLETALIHHKMWNNGRWEFASEVRLRAAKFGATPEDRMRLRAEIHVPDEYAQGGESHVGVGADVTDIRSRRSRIAEGDS